MGALIFLGAFSSALAYIFWFKALSIFTVAKVAVFQFLQPIAGVVISYFLVGKGSHLAVCRRGDDLRVWLVNKR